MRFAGCKYINKSIAGILKTKTPKQISDKRRLLANTPTEAQTICESAADSNDSDAEGVRENSNDEAQRPRASRKTPASIPKHRDVDDQLTQAEELLGARKDLDTLALGIGLVESITDLLLNSRKRQDKNKKPRKDRAKKDKKPGSNTGAKKRWAASKALFRTTQLLYKTNRRQLAREIMGAPTSSACPLAKEELETCFREKLSKANEKSNINKYAPYSGKVDDGSLMKPIEVEEVEAAIKGIDQNSAAGPDGLKLEDIRALHEEEETRLPRLFSLWLKSSTIPDSLKKSRTVLIPKCEDKERLKNIDNWRPITIGPMLLRLFTKIMAKRLSETVEINPRQKGFLAATPGCNEKNQCYLNKVFKAMKLKDFVHFLQLCTFQKLLEN
ncbi:uncharacterized protein LOC132211014 [Stegostoma tigrinum]|uniref:uncharacterized protein LOC132211014 n=1 Tax=Stegostoma tigrinum TaxID=3053191 RepID=UPI0028703ABF|nr:uncharacterized protein LOC132211014 [Stegostoma tigrinum]